MPPTTRRVPLGAIAASLYVLSLWTPAIVVFQKPLIWGPPREETLFGIQCLLIGWIAFPWYANVALAIAAIALSYRRFDIAVVLSIVAFMLAFSTPVYLGLELRVLHVGYFAWLASIVVVFAAACVGPRHRLEDEVRARGDRDLVSDHQSLLELREFRAYPSSHSNSPSCF